MKLASAWVLTLLALPVSVEAEITEADFDEILARVERAYAPIVRAKGAELAIDRDWRHENPNAFASREGRVWSLHFYGGLARRGDMTGDAFVLVACHELGHHLGGAPRDRRGKDGDWSSLEGQADYWAALKCVRRIWAARYNRSIVSTIDVPMPVRQGCGESFRKPEDAALCMRSALAGRALARAGPWAETEPAPDFDVPDRSRTARTDDRGLGKQCRLDTIYAGALCAADPDAEVDADDPGVSACASGPGSRPACWFNPESGG